MTRMIADRWPVLRALRSRNYRLYFVGQGLSLIGTWMTYVATAWLVYRLTHSAVLLGIVGFAGQLPAGLLSPLAGVLVDRWDRRRVLIVTQALAMLQSLGLAALALTGVITVGQIIALSVVQGLINAFDLPARQAFVIEMVERPEDLANAIALNSSLFNGARLIGPSLAGLLIAAAGEGVCFLVDGMSYLAVLAAFWAMRRPPRGPRPPPRSLLGEWWDGFDYATRFAPVKAILLLTALVSLVGLPYTILMPIVAHDVLRGGPHTLGFLMAASGLGALVGALYLASRRTVVGLGRTIPLAAAGFGLSLMAFGGSHTVWVSLLLVTGVGFGMLVQLAASNIVVQTLVDEEKRGRVMSFYAMAFMGMAPFGSLLAGHLAARIGAPNTLVFGGIGCLAGAAVFARQLPRLRAIIRPIYVSKGILPEVAAGLQATTNALTPPKE